MRNDATPVSKSNLLNIGTDRVNSKRPLSLLIKEHSLYHETPIFMCKESGTFSSATMRKVLSCRML